MVCFATNIGLDARAGKRLERISDSAKASESLSSVVAAVAAAEELAAAAAASSFALSTHRGLMMQFSDVVFPFLH